MYKCDHIPVVWVCNEWMVVLFKIVSSTFNSQTHAVPWRSKHIWIVRLFYPMFIVWMYEARYPCMIHAPAMCQAQIQKLEEGLSSTLVLCWGGLGLGLGQVFFSLVSGGLMFNPYLFYICLLWAACRTRFVCGCVETSAGSFCVKVFSVWSLCGVIYEWT